MRRLSKQTCDRFRAVTIWDGRFGDGYAPAIRTRHRSPTSRGPLPPRYTRGLRSFVNHQSHQFSVAGFKVFEKPAKDEAGEPAGYPGDADGGGHFTWMLEMV